MNKPKTVGEELSLTGKSIAEVYAVLFNRLLERLSHQEAKEAVVNTCRSCILIIGNADKEQEMMLDRVAKVSQMIEDVPEDNQKKSELRKIVKVLKPLINEAVALQSVVMANRGWLDTRENIIRNIRYVRSLDFTLTVLIDEITKHLPKKEKIKKIKGLTNKDIYESKINEIDKSERDGSR